jgi:hypothetical protein
MGGALWWDVPCSTHLALGPDLGGCPLAAGQLLQVKELLGRPLTRDEYMYELGILEGGGKLSWMGIPAPELRQLPPLQFAGLLTDSPAARMQGAHLTCTLPCQCA